MEFGDVLSSLEWAEIEGNFPTPHVLTVVCMGQDGLSVKKLACQREEG